MDDETARELIAGLESLFTDPDCARENTVTALLGIYNTLQRALGGDEPSPLLDSLDEISKSLSRIADKLSPETKEPK